MFIGRFTIGNTFGRCVAPHVGHPFSDVFAAVTGLAPLKIEPHSILPGAIVGVRAVMDTRGLMIIVPSLNLLATSGHVSLVP